MKRIVNVIALVMLVMVGAFGCESNPNGSYGGPVYYTPNYGTNVGAIDTAGPANAYLEGRRAASEASYTGGTVYVRGYYRKDGTYVRPHTRRAPRR